MNQRRERDREREIYLTVLEMCEINVGEWKSLSHSITKCSNAAIINGNTRWLSLCHGWKNRYWQVSWHTLLHYRDMFVLLMTRGISI